MPALARSVAVAILAVMFLTPGLGALAQEFGDAEAGRALAREVCATCHAVEDGDGAYPAAPAFRAIAEVPGMTSTAITVILRTPHREMPDLILTPEEIRDVGAYILTLKESR